MEIKDELPPHYTPLREPFYAGEGQHSVNVLEHICESFKEYSHQCAIRLQSLRQENKKLSEALQNIMDDPCFVHLLSSNQKLAQEALK